jgi:hypothetical protein
VANRRRADPARSIGSNATAPRRVKLHIVVDNYGTHTDPTVQVWLAKNQRIRLHFMRTYDQRVGN